MSSSDTYIPMFSASYSDRFDEHQRQRAAQKRPRATWKRGLRVDSETVRLGYYLEERTPSPAPEALPNADSETGPSTSRASTPPLPRSATADTNRATSREEAAPSKRASHGGLRVYIRNLQIVLPGFSLFSQPPSGPRRSRRMAVKTHLFVSLWFALSIPVIFWDAAYCFMRPRSMVGGDLHWIWKPYALYQEVDYIYGVKALQEGDGFPNAQSLLNVVENFMNIGYLYLAHVKGSPFATLLGFASAVMTLSKTTLYWLQEYYCGGCSIGHNTLYNLIVLWVIPNGLWLLVPTFIIWRLGKDINTALHVAERASKKEASGKKH